MTNLKKFNNNSKITGEQLRATVEAILKQAKTNKRGFVESVEVQFKIKNYDLRKDKRFSGSVKLPTPARPNMPICVLGDQQHCDEAKAKGYDFRSLDDLKKLAGQPKAIKRFSQKFGAFLASDALIKQIPRVRKLGPGLSKAGKFPAVVTHSDNLTAKMSEIRSTVKFQLRKEVNLGCACGTVGDDADDLCSNINMIINFFISLLKKNWQNIASVHCKSTMGKSHRLY